MGTKIHCAIDPLAAAPISTGFTLNYLDDCNFLHDKLVKDKEQIINFDRMVEQPSTESIKKTMLMHEDVFKYQVRELHRLYKVQKILMEKLKNEVNQVKFWGPMSGSETSYSNFLNKRHSTVQTTCGHNLRAQNLMRDNPNSREHSSSCSGSDNLRTPMCFDLERPATNDDITTAVRPNQEDQAGSSNPWKCSENINQLNDRCYEEAEVELTLSIGGSSSSSKKKAQNHKAQRSLDLACSESSTHNEIMQIGSSASIKSDQREECRRDPIDKVGSSTTAIFDQERKKPTHWLFQSPGLNKT